MFDNIKKIKEGDYIDESNIINLDEISKNIHNK